MFDRYSDAARRIIFFARYEAGALGSAGIDTHHLLLGVLRENQDLFKPYFDVLTEPAAIRQELIRRFPPVAQNPMDADMALTGDARTVLEYASEEADRLGHKVIQPVHILIALTRVAGGVAAGMLARYGIGAEVLRVQAAERSASEAVLRQGAALLLDALPEERLQAAERILSALTMPDVSVTVKTTLGRSVFTFGDPDAPLPHGFTLDSPAA